MRIVQHLGPGTRLPPSTSGIAATAGELVHCALNVQLADVVILGSCFPWSQRVPFAFFVRFVVPVPYQSNRCPSGNKSSH